MKDATVTRGGPLSRLPTLAALGSAAALNFPGRVYVSVGRARMLTALGVVMAASLVPPGSAMAADLGFPLGKGVFAQALATGADGNVWFAARSYGSIGELGTQQIGSVTGDGDVKEYTVPEPPAGVALSIAAGADDNLWFTEGNGIGRITPGGGMTFFPLPGGETPTALTRGPDGNVWFTAERPNTVGRISPAGDVTEFPVSAGSPPTAITAGPAGALWAVEPKAGRIGRITTGGGFREFRLPGDRTRPDSIALGGDGNLWFGEESKPRVGRITPAGKVTFFPVPTIEGTRSLISGPGGLLWFTAGDELGAISTSGVARWPTCLNAACNFPPAALTTGPNGRIWVASEPGFCYGGGGSCGFKYLTRPGGLGPLEQPPLVVGIGPRLAPLRHGHTSVLLACGHRAACRGILRVRSMVRLPREVRLWPVVTVPYSLAAGEWRHISIPMTQRDLTRIHTTGFLVLNAARGHSTLDRRGFYFWPSGDGTAKR